MHVPSLEPRIIPSHAVSRRYLCGKLERHPYQDRPVLGALVFRRQELTAS